MSPRVTSAKRPPPEVASHRIGRQFAIQGVQSRPVRGAIAHMYPTSPDTNAEVVQIICRSGNTAADGRGAPFGCNAGHHARDHKSRSNSRRLAAKISESEGDFLTTEPRALSRLPHGGPRYLNISYHRKWIALRLTDRERYLKCMSARNDPPVAQNSGGSCGIPQSPSSERVCRTWAAALIGLKRRPWRRSARSRSSSTPAKRSGRGRLASSGDDLPDSPCSRC